MSKILIVDDEPDIRESLKVTLAQHQIILAGNGREALEKVDSEKPDLVLLDVNMPVMDGFETCRRLKQNAETKPIPVLMLTALHDLDNKIKGLDAGADDFIGKPFNDMELRARVRAFLRTKQLHDQLEENYLKLRELETLRDSLTHMIVHDLKVPLTSVKGGIFVALEAADSGPLDEPHKKLLRNAATSSQRILDLIQDILDVSRMEENRLPVHKSNVDVAELAQSCIAALEPLSVGNGIKIASQLPKEFPAVLDEALLQRVLTNLLSNSLKFTERGGSVTLRVNRLSKENQMELSVEDTGAGIPKEHLEKIFDKFFQSGGNEVGRKGQGLGLAFCRMAVESLGGKIWAESPGKGSRFVIRLPVS